MLTAKTGHSMLLCATLIAGSTMLPALVSAQTQLPNTAPLPPTRDNAPRPGVAATIPGATPSAMNRPLQVTQPTDEDKKKLIERVNAYFNSITTLVGNFTQIGPDGSKTEGDFYLQKPGKVRFDYNPPSPVELIADGSSVVVRDRRLATQDLYPLSQTPLKFLLSNKLDLAKDTNVVGVFEDSLFTTVTIEEKHPVVGTHRLMIMFGAQDNQLKQWTVTDPQGFDTTVSVFNLDNKQKPDPALFRIDYTRYPTIQQ
jgi:outer membrane lipoprotein-sorting protein